MQRNINKKNKKPSLKVVANKYRKDLMLNRTNTEKVFAYILSKLAVTYKEQYIVYTHRSFYIVDFFLPVHRIIFEVDGKQHLTPEGLAKDNIRDSTLATLGFTVKRFRNIEVYNPRKCEKRIKSILGIKQNKFF